MTRQQYQSRKAKAERVRAERNSAGDRVAEGLEQRAAAREAEDPEGAAALRALAARVRQRQVRAGLGL